MMNEELAIDDKDQIRRKSRRITIRIEIELENVASVFNGERSISLGHVNEMS